MLRDKLEGRGGEEGGRESRTEGHVYACGWSMLMYRKNHHSIVK